MGQKIDSAAGGQSLQVKGGDPLAGAADEVEGAQSALEEMSERLARAEVKSAEDRAHLVDTALKSLRSLASCESPSLDRRSALWPHSNPTSLFTLPLSLAPSASLHLCPSFAHPFAPHLCPLSVHTSLALPLSQRPLPCSTTDLAHSTLALPLSQRPLPCSTTDLAHTLAGLRLAGPQESLLRIRPYGPQSAVPTPSQSILPLHIPSSHPERSHAVKRWGVGARAGLDPRLDPHADANGGAPYVIVSSSSAPPYRRGGLWPRERSEWPK